MVWAHSKSGFTIVELLVVIVVIGILAAVTIIAFNGVQERALVSVLKSDLRNAGTQLETLKVDDPAGEYTDDPDQLTSSEGVSFQLTSTGATYCLTASSSNTDVPTYYISSDTKTVTEGICPGHTPPGAPNPGPFTQIATSSSHTCGVANGLAYCWGSASNGKLGNGQTTGTYSTPVAVDTSLMSGTVSAIATGPAASCAIADGSAYCWGNAQFGRLGNGQTSGTYSTPVAVNTSLMSGTVTDIVVGDSHTCAIADGSAYCWGFGFNGRVGNGLTSGGSTPLAVSTSVMSGTVTSISASAGHSCAIADSKAYCWGTGTSRQLGNGGTSNQLSPVAVTDSVMSGTVTDIATGSTHSCAVANSQAYCWGSNGNGVLGIAPISGNQATPVAVNTSIMSGAVSAIAVAGHSCAIASGNVYCWGTGTSGQLGDGNTTTQFAPVAVDTSIMDGTVTDIGVSDITQHSCALVQGRAYCWGRGDSGQLGDGLSTGSQVPVLVTNPSE